MLRFRYRMRPRKMSKASGRKPDGHGTGPEGRILRLRQLVTAIVRYERIEGCRHHMDETRGYVERLIQEAQKNGDKHANTMEMADFWLLEKDLIHKLFKVLVPRYRDYQTSLTQIYTLPTKIPGPEKTLGILELKGNPWPPVLPHHRNNRGSLINVLLDEARKEYDQQKFDLSTPGGAVADTSTPPVERDLSDEVADLRLDEVPPNVPKEGTPV